MLLHNKITIGMSLCSLPSVLLTQGKPYESLSPDCLWYESQRHFCSAAYLFDTCSYGMIYVHQEIPQYTCILWIGIWELATKRLRPHRWNRISFVAKNEKSIRRLHMREYVEDFVAYAVPTGHDINTEKSHFHCPALLSWLSWTLVIFRTN